MTIPGSNGARGFATVFILAASATGAFGQAGIDIYHEFYGPRAYTDPAAASNLRNGMATGVALSPPVDSGMARFVASRYVNLMLTLAGSALPGGLSADSIETQRAAMANLANSLPNQKVLWNLMNEWDQSGGPWVSQGRPTYSGLTRTGAYNKFFDYYLNTLYPLATYLQGAPGQRPYTMAAVTDYSPNVFYAYEMGVDLCLMEKAIDELADISTGVAFVRGAAGQYNRQWGIDVSTWRTSNGLATSFDSQGNLLGGWSPSYLKRHYYIAYMSGAQVLRNEATVYYQPNGNLNPFGQMTKDFADFALRRHPDVGQAAVPAALLIDHASGFDPKHWVYNQSDTVWYGDIPYSAGDAMINNFLKLAYPNHWLHGLAPGAPFADSAGNPNPARFRQYLAGGGDPRPYEPMTFTRWGDSFDIITNRASLDAMRRYKTIIVLGGVVIDSNLHDALQAWVEAGGVLVVNTSQVTSSEEALAGVTLTRGIRVGNTSQWLADGVPYTEPAFRYTVVKPVTATVLATNGGADPLITSNQVGAGQVILTTPSYLQSSARDQLLAVGARLFDWLEARFAVVRVTGPPVEYIVNQTADSVIVTLLNHSGSAWNGSVSTDTARTVSAVREYTADQGVSAVTVSGATISVAAQVPPYDLRIYAIEFSGN
jgi:hypothetical protein